MLGGGEGVKRDLTTVCFLAQIPFVILSRSLNLLEVSEMRKEFETRGQGL